MGLPLAFDQAVAAMTRVRDTFQPDPATHQLYDELYRKIYLKMYKQLKPLYEEIWKLAR